MSKQDKKIQNIDPVWGRIQDEASALIFSRTPDGWNGTFKHLTPIVHFEKP